MLQGIQHVNLFFIILFHKESSYYRLKISCSVDEIWLSSVSGLSTRLFLILDGAHRMAQALHWLLWPFLFNKHYLLWPCLTDWLQLWGMIWLWWKLRLLDLLCDLVLAVATTWFMWPILFLEMYIVFTIMCFQWSFLSKLCLAKTSFWFLYFGLILNFVI